MNYLSLFSSHNLALLSDWLRETGELYVDIYLPRSGGGSSAYFIRSMNDLKSLIAQQTHPEIVIAIFRYLQYPIRGIADEKLLKQALQRITDGDWYTIVSLENVYPFSVAWWGNGRSHQELEHDFADVLGEKVGIGINPDDAHNGDWRKLSHEEVFTLSVIRNQNYYERYAKESENYAWVIDLWQA
ncbi:MAG: hypothetical protein IT320_22715 [Anaerolineae bacterium]|nr:hypothetical protein [Anaerolineae bacterium]